MTETKLGTLPDIFAQRDAVHIATLPAVAGELLLPGHHVAVEWIAPVWLASRRSPATIGIVDPFLRKPVEKGNRFYICLYPGSISSLRHVWQHSAIPEPT